MFVRRLIGLALASGGLVGCSGCESQPAGSDGASTAAAPEASLTTPPAPSASSSVPALSAAAYQEIQAELYARLLDRIVEATNRTYCSEDELIVARHRLTPGGYTSMDEILDKHQATRESVMQYVLTHLHDAQQAGSPAARHAEAMAKMEAKARLDIQASSKTCASQAEGCERTFLKFLELQQALEQPSDEAAAKDLRGRLFEGMGGFLNSCERGEHKADFACIDNAASSDEFSGCTLSNGLRAEWLPARGP